MGGALLCKLSVLRLHTSCMTKDRELVEQRTAHERTVADMAAQRLEAAQDAARDVQVRLAVLCALDSVQWTCNIDCRVAGSSRTAPEI